MKITLKNVKAIRSLEFPIPDKGLWLLTGLNGGGKTTLLACLYRISYPRAFQDYFHTSATQSKLDTFQNAQIKYEISGQEVTYRYAGRRWPPTPKRNSGLLNQFPFPKVFFIEANSDRVEPHPDDIVPRNIHPAEPQIRNFLTSVTRSSKWKRLSYVNTRRGVGNRAFLIPYRSKSETHYYSEKNFSLGELCVLKLARRLAQAPAGSLILIDEVEMALHPQAQVRLITQLEELAGDQALTILISSHSATLIKHIDRKQTIFLAEGATGHFTAHFNVFSATILGSLAFEEELDCDCLFFVEDDAARHLLEQAIGLWQEHQSSLPHAPTYRIIPVGPYERVLEMRRQAREFAPNFIRRVAVLDADVWPENLEKSAPNKNPHARDIYSSDRKDIYFLPCTPEPGLVEIIENDLDAGLMERLRLDVHGKTINLEPVLLSERYRALPSGHDRKTSKKKVSVILDQLESRCSLHRSEIQRKLYRWYCDERFYNDVGALEGLIRPMFLSK